MINRRYIFAISEFPLGDWIFEIPNVIISVSNEIYDFKGILNGDANRSYK